MDTYRNDQSTPLFVLGNPRSGTTLFRLMLTSHSRIGIAPECEFVVRLFPRFGHLNNFTENDVDSFLQDVGGRVLDIGEMWDIPLEKLIGNRRDLIGLSYRDVCREIYLAYQKAKGFPCPVYWGDKNNAHGNYIDVLAYLFPMARFIHIVRDGRAVFYSYKKLRIDSRQKYAPNLPRDPSLVGFLWADMVERIDRHLNKFARGRFLVVRYEDILDRPEREMRSVCDFLGLEYESEMLQYHKVTRTYSLEPEAYSWKKNTNKPIELKRKIAWLYKLNPVEIRQVEAVAALQLEKHGYDLANRVDRKNLDLRHVGKCVKARLREGLRRARLLIVVIRGKVHY